MIFFFFVLSATAWGQLPQGGNVPVSTASAEATDRLQQGLALYDLGESQEARELFLEAVALDPSFSLAHTYLAYSENTSEEAVERLQTAGKYLEKAGPWEKLYYEWMEATLSENWPKRYATAQKMVAAYPGLARAWLLAAFAYEDLEQTEDARTAYKKAIALAPGWHEAYQQLAASYLSAEPKDLELAYDNAQKVVALVPRHAGSLVLLGEVYGAQHRWEDAVTAFSKAIELDPANSGAYYKRGNVYSVQEKYEEARADYRLGGVYNTDFPAQTAQNIAYTYLYQGDFSKALQTIFDAEGKSKNSGDAYRDLAGQFNFLGVAARIAFHAGDAPALTAVLQRWDPVSDGLAKEVGVDELGRNIKANMLYWKGLNEALKGEYEQALARGQEIRQVLAPISNPDKLEPYHSLMGHILYRQGDFDRAITHFEQTDKNSVYENYWRAKSYEAMGTKGMALELYKRIAANTYNDVGNALIRSEVKKLAGQ